MIVGINKNIYIKIIYFQKLNPSFLAHFSNSKATSSKINDSVFPKDWSYHISDKEQNFEITFFIPLKEKERIQRIVARKKWLENYEKDLEEAIVKAIKLIEGAFGLAIIDNKEEKIIAVRKGSPIILGIGEKEFSN